MIRINWSKVVWWFIIVGLCYLAYGIGLAIVGGFQE